MSSENMSKRERQKRRREAKLAQQRAAESRARRTRLLVFALIGVIFVSLIGVAIARQQAQRAEQVAQEQEAAANREALGCTEHEQMEDRGQTHIASTEMAQQPPELIYPDRPATSGPHYGNWLITGVYDELMDERALVHNLEHGYVVAYYTQDAPEEQVDALKETARSHIDGTYPKIIVSPWDGDLPNDGNFAYTAWNRRQVCEQYDDDVFEVFLRNFHSGAGEAPEKTIPAHLAPTDGQDPGDEPFLLPPLGQEAPEEGMEEGEELPDDDPAEGEQTT